MALITRDRITDPGMRYLMVDIITTQQAQIGPMQVWLRTWGLTASDAGELPMVWAGASGSSRPRRRSRHECYVDCRGRR